MGGNKMSQTEYDLKAIMYSAYDTLHKLGTIGEIKLSATQVTTQ